MSGAEETINASTHGQPNEPAFLRRRVDEYFCGRIAQAWNGRHLFHGRTPDGNSVLLVDNDYLDIAGHPQIRQAQIDSLQKQDAGIIMSAVYLHGDNPQKRLERRLASFLHMEDAILCQSGYAANVGLLQSITAPATPVYIDMRAHASLWEGVLSAGARAIPFRHNSPAHLERRVQRGGPGIVVLDSVYSTDGSVAPLKAFIDVIERHGCVSVVDESHSLGTHGGHGEGMVASMNLAHRVHFITASLAKAFAGRAGLIAGSGRLAEYISYHSRPAIFSSALLAHEIAGLDAALDVIRDAHERRACLHRNTARLQHNLDRLGYNVDASEAQIIGLESGSEARTFILRDALESRGVFGSVFCAPATAKNRALIRLSINAGLTSAQIDRVIDACRDMRDEVDLANWASTRRKKGRSRAALAHAA